MRPGRKLQGFVSVMQRQICKKKRHGKDGGRVGKETPGKRNRSKKICFKCGQQDHEKARCPILRGGDKKTTVQPQRKASATAPSAGVSAVRSTSFCK